MSRQGPPNSLEHEAFQKTQTCQYCRVKDMEPGRAGGNMTYGRPEEAERDAWRGFGQLRRHVGGAVDKDSQCAVHGLQ